MIRHLLCLLLALTLAATSVSVAVMHSEMQGANQIEICADSHDGSGLTTITLDATGKQITHHSCPDCTAAFAAMPAKLTQGRAPQSYRASIFVQIACDATSRSAPTQSARDPPAFA